MNTVQNSCPLIPSQKGSHWVAPSTPRKRFQSLTPYLAVLVTQILLAGGLEDYEGNRVCFPTIMSPRYKRLSKKNWCEGRYQWLKMFSLAFKDIVLSGSALLSNIFTSKLCMSRKSYPQTAVCLSTIQQ